MLRLPRREKYRRFSFYFQQGLLFLFFLELLLLFFYLAGSFQNLRDSTVLGIMFWLEKVSLAYLILGVYFITETLVEQFLYKKANWRFFVFVAVTFTVILPVYAILLVSESLVSFG